MQVTGKKKCLGILISLFPLPFFLRIDLRILEVTNEMCDQKIHEASWLITETVMSIELTDATSSFDRLRLQRQGCDRNTGIDLNSTGMCDSSVINCTSVPH